MTLTNLLRRVSYIGNGATTVFAYAFPILDAAHAEVFLTELATGVETALLTSQYTISGIDSPTGGNVTYPLTGSPLASTHRITIRRTLDYTQDLDIHAQTGFQPTAVEDQLDLIVMMIQQLSDETPITIKGNYSTIVTYYKGDIAFDNGSTWIALQETLGNAPPTLPITNNTWWQLVAKQGDAGTPGLGDMIGPAGAADGQFVKFDGSTGKFVKAGTTTIATNEIAASAVTYAKIQNISATDRVLGRSTAGAGDMEEIVFTAAARALADDADAAAQRVTLVTSVIVATYTALKALDTTKDVVAFLSEAGREGVFAWRSGDYSTKVAADTREGIFVKADAIAATAGAWVREAGFQISGMALEWFGLTLDGSADNAAALTGVQALATLIGAPVNVPPGIIRLDSTITWKTAVHWRGAGKASGIYSALYSFFHINHTGIGFTNDDNAGSRSMSGCNFYRTQPAVGIGWAPTAHDFDVKLEGAQDITIQDCHFHNATKAIQIRGRTTGAINSGRVFLHRVTGQPMQTGIDATHCLDSIYIDEVHFWPFWSADANVTTYTRANLEAFKFGRCDHPELGRVLSWGAFRAVTIYNQGADGALPTGTVNHLHAGYLSADNTNVGILVNTGADSATWSVDKAVFASDSAAPSISTESLLWCLANTTRGHVDSLYGQYTNASLVAINGSGNQIVIGSSQSTAIDNDGGGSGEFNVDAGNTLVLLSAPLTSAGAKYVGAGTFETPDLRIIGTHIQAYDADLTTWAGITPGANVGTFLATPSSANLAAAVTGESGTGALLFGTSPMITTNLLFASGPTLTWDANTLNVDKAIYATAPAGDIGVRVIAGPGGTGSIQITDNPVTTSLGIITGAPAGFTFNTVGGTFFQSSGVTKLQLTSVGNVVVGAAALATNATDGFLYIPTCAGTPTGTPTAFTGRVAMVFDSTNRKLYLYNGAWQRAQVTAVDAIWA